MYDNRQMSDRIKNQAKTKKVALKKMLEDLDLGINLISQLAKGQNISAISLAKIADYLNCSVDYLLGRADKKETANTAEFTDLFERLTLEQQSLVLSQLKGILSSRES